MKTILVCGDRHWNDFAIIRRELEKLPKDTKIVEGACSGADCITEYVAMQLGLTVIPEPAEWDKWKRFEQQGKCKTHRAAGVIRNQKMLDNINQTKSGHSTRTWRRVQARKTWSPEPGKLASQSRYSQSDSDYNEQKKYHDVLDTQASHLLAALSGSTEWCTRKRRRQYYLHFT